jgi:hypothetical protein
LISRLVVEKHAAYLVPKELEVLLPVAEIPALLHPLRCLDCSAYHGQSSGYDGQRIHMGWDTEPLVMKMLSKFVRGEIMKSA